jgi:hypothetical protein
MRSSNLLHPWDSVAFYMSVSWSQSVVVMDIIVINVRLYVSLTRQDWSILGLTGLACSVASNHDSLSPSKG